MIELRYTVSGPPVPWQRARSNGKQRWTAPKMRHAKIAHQLTAIANRPRGWPLDARYELEVTAFCLPIQRGDADNYGKLVSDALQGALYTNDRRVTRCDSRREIDRDRPRTEVVVRILETTKPPRKR